MNGGTSGERTSAGEEGVLGGGFDGGGGGTKE